MQANKNGFFYVIDRLTGQFISAEPFAAVTWATGIEQKTGRPMVNEAMYYGSEPVRFSPGTAGAHNWAPMAFNHTTGLVYIPTATNSSTALAAEARFDGTLRPLATGTRFASAPALPTVKAIGPPPLEGNAGALVAWDPVAQRMRWRVPGGGERGTGALTTAGNLVFQTLGDGRLLAYSADKGDKLLEIATGVRGGMGPPITYLIDGKQYVALLGGAGPSSLTSGAARAGGPPPAALSAPAAPPSPKLFVFALTQD